MTDEIFRDNFCDDIFRNSDQIVDLIHREVNDIDQISCHDTPPHVPNQHRPAVRPI